MEEAREKKYLEIPLSKILKFRPYRRLLFCIYILFSHDEITIEEIQQKLNNPSVIEFLYNHRRDRIFPILKCNQCLFFHQITDTDPPKFLEIFKTFRTIEFPHTFGLPVYLQDEESSLSSSLSSQMYLGN